MIGAVVLTLVGLGFVLAEVFFPSFGILSLVAGGLILGADVLAFQEGDGVGWAFITAQVLLVPMVVWLGFRALPHVGFGRRMLLMGPATRPGAGLPDLSSLTGRRGVALTALRPAGMASIGEERLSVVAQGGMVPAGASLVVVSVEGAEVRVRPEPAAGPPAPQP